MNNFFKHILFLLFILQTVNANDKVSVQLLWKHQFEFAGFYMAKEKGFYKDVDLDVTIKEFDFGINIVDDVLSGKSDFGVGRSSLILDRLKSKKITLLNAFFQSSPYVLISKERDDIQTIKDFKNKKIMLSDDLESIAAISSMMKVANIKSSDYYRIKHSFNIDDLINGNVDLMTTYLSNEPFYLKEQNIKYTIFNPKEYGFDFYADILFTSQKYRDTDTQKMIQFQESTLEGWKYAFNHIDETIELILQKYNTQNKSKEALLYEAGILKELACVKGVEFGTIENSRVQEIANIYRLLGLTNETNDALKSLVYRPITFMDELKKIFTVEVFFLFIAFVVLTFLLSQYKQYILKQQNIDLEGLVDEKTKELQLINEHLEERIQERTQELELAIRVKSDFLANMSHEIRTPLNGIIGFVDILQKKENNSEKKEKLSIIKESSYLLLTIINDILDFSKIEKGKMDIEHIELDLHHIFKHIVELFFDKADENKIEIVLNIDKNLPKRTLGDSTRLKQIFSNLISNAIKFSYKESQIVVNLKYLEDTNKLYCEIIDSGIGISVDKVDTIFKSFEQADNSVNRVYGGTGLGLSISKALVESMGGEIGLHSTLSLGSTFYFTIPLFEVENREEIVEDVVAIHSQEKELKGCVLIVEDNKTNQMLLGMLLDDFNLQYDISNDGIEAVEAVKNKSYDLILMDENMPNMNGIVATQIIRETQSSETLPIIAVTANALNGDRERFLKNGMNEYISKPIDVDILQDVLCRFLAKENR